MKIQSSSGYLSLFPTTHWSLVQRVGDDDSAVRRRALADLLNEYLPPLRTYIKFRLRLGYDEADDLLQGFVADSVLERDLISKALQQKGKFRTFLLTALNNYASNERVCQTRLKRNPAAQGGWLVPLVADVAGHERPLEIEDCKAGDPVDAFEVAWARQVLMTAVEGMRRECNAMGRADLWGVFEARILKTMLDGDEPTPYEQLMGRFKIATAAEASNLLVTAKRMLARSLKAVVGRYEREPSAIEAEIAELRAILSRPRGRA